jgi:hypothetical protein
MAGHKTFQILTSSQQISYLVACIGLKILFAASPLQLYLQHLVFVTPLLLSAAIVEELEPV